MGNAAASSDSESLRTLNAFLKAVAVSLSLINDRLITIIILIVSLRK